MRRLNYEYRKIDSTTDVLSFHYFDDFATIGSTEVAGEILLSESKILSQAKAHDHSEEKEAYILILHGVLHILGYDHETDEEYKEMWLYEEVLREKL
jgi:probable rRNA maturation factor